MNEKAIKSITVFSTPTCPWCTVLKKYLMEKKISFNNIDVSSDSISAAKMVMKSGQMGVPQMWIDENIVVGFNKSRIDSLLGF